MLKVYVMKKNFDPIEISNISRVTNEISTVDIGISSVDSFNYQISKFILNDGTLVCGDLNLEEWFRADDIIGVCYHILRWRRCTAYFVIQFSEKGFRHLCYFSDEIKHNGQSFGTSVETVDKNQVFTTIRSNLETFLNSNKIMKIFLSDKRTLLLENLENYQDFFGI
jgi:hypothetical protein